MNHPNPILLCSQKKKKKEMFNDNLIFMIARYCIYIMTSDHNIVQLILITFFLFMCSFKGWVFIVVGEKKKGGVGVTTVHLCQMVDIIPTIQESASENESTKLD